MTQQLLNEIPFLEIRPRIIPAIFMETIILIFFVTIAVDLYIRFSKNSVNNEQTRIISLSFFSWAVALFFSIIGKILQYYNSFQINQTELGIISNWSVTLFFVNLGIMFQIIFVYIVFPQSQTKKLRILIIGALMFGISCLTFPRYYQNIEIPGVYPIKFLGTFSLIMIGGTIFIREARSVMLFNSKEFLEKKLRSQIRMHQYFILVFVFLAISSIYGNFTGQYYTWGYYLAMCSLLISAIYGYLGTTKMSDEERRVFKKQDQKAHT